METPSPFTLDDLRQLSELGIHPDEALRQLEIFRNPPPPVRIRRSCVIGDGITTLPEEEHAPLLELANGAQREGRISKFVPASGAATRMFQELLAYLEGQGEGTAVERFFANLERFPFYEELKAALTREGRDLRAFRDTGREGERREVLRCLLTDEGLGYASLPKALIPFHRYPEGPRTAFEEHLVEAAGYIRDRHGRCRLHFTIPPESFPRFETALATARRRFEEPFKATFEVSFSEQKPATDTLAVDLDNRPFRLDDGSLLLRPGGHGSLIENLNELDGDLVVLANVDNVLPDRRKPPVIRWRKLLVGYLLQIQGQIFRHLEDLASPVVAESTLREAFRFLRETLQVEPPGSLQKEPPEAHRLYLVERLDRPLRVCGVVPKGGEMGGGPFWVELATGEVSPQIVEAAQLNPSLPQHQKALEASTHFNPVQIAGALRDGQGRQYDLLRHVDHEAVFLTRKFHQGRPLKALERPGLWNGAMAGWNTLFVEVPGETFGPVKTVWDLLHPLHQS